MKKLKYALIVLSFGMMWSCSQEVYNEVSEQVESDPSSSIDRGGLKVQDLRAIVNGTHESSPADIQAEIDNSQSVIYDFVKGNLVISSTEEDLEDYIGKDAALKKMLD